MSASGPGHAAARAAASSGRFANTATHGKWRQLVWHVLPAADAQDRLGDLPVLLAVDDGRRAGDQHGLG
eukprot:1936699-Prymnesium_polylepis.1